ncbi:DUF5343 domain-containing protein [Stutzerimonas nitrititolerans]|uniref:DUF5343 domain-containing protein n=1 Tax=Stutzerimonas nitrititolerans TaxID=2482751 RepID=UPI001BDC058E|nr:DUF5343 domain-containing protein [Stutzerimonas nitrititolerans]MBT1118464.1 DUF5343 domain-containing protein [Stutzerimonas nitrititolerans]
MAIKHPYVPSAGIIMQTFLQFRKMFPAKVDASTLQKLSLAPKNEAAVINTLKFLGFLDDDCKKTSNANETFLKHNDDEFSVALAERVKAAYSEIFENFGAAAWEADRETLISFFRVHDETSPITATRQAITYETLASLSGHREAIQVRAIKPKSNTKTASPQSSKSKAQNQSKDTTESPVSTAASSRPTLDIQPSNSGLGLTVRIEINLPAQGDQETYDRIFQSIRKNLING